MTPESRIEEISQTIEGIRAGWKFVQKEIETRIAILTESLVSAENEQVRGKIKVLKELKDWPELLESERQGLKAELSETDSA